MLVGHVTVGQNQRIGCMEAWFCQVQSHILLLILISITCISINITEAISWLSPLIHKLNCLKARPIYTAWLFLLTM